VIRNAILLTVIVLSLLSQGCGWRLRGQIDLPPGMEKTFLSGVDFYSELGVEIQARLQGAGAGLVQDKSAATAILHIVTNKIEKRVLSIDSSGRAGEYELSYLLVFRLMDQHGAVLVNDQTVTTLRELRFDPNNVLSTGDEEERLRKDMLQFSVRQMLNRLNISLQKSRNTNQ